MKAFIDNLIAKHGRKGYWCTELLREAVIQSNYDFFDCAAYIETKGFFI